MVIGIDEPGWFLLPRYSSGTGGSRRVGARLAGGPPDLRQVLPPALARRLGGARRKLVLGKRSRAQGAFPLRGTAEAAALAQEPRTRRTRSLHAATPAAVGGAPLRWRPRDLPIALTFRTEGMLCGSVCRSYQSTTLNGPLL